MGGPCGSEVTGAEPIRVRGQDVEPDAHEAVGLLPSWIPRPRWYSLPPQTKESPCLIQLGVPAVQGIEPFTASEF